MAPNPPSPDADRPSLRGLGESLRYAKSRPDLLGTYLIDIGAMLFGAPYAVFPQIAARLREPAEWLALIADPLLAQFAIDRLQSAAYELVLDGESYRQRQKPAIKAGTATRTRASRGGAAPAPPALPQR